TADIANKIGVKYRNIRILKRPCKLGLGSAIIDGIKMAHSDVLAVMDAGAYGYVMSSQYNSRPRGAEVLVMDGKHELVREAETLESLLLGQKIASWLT
ncbi:MAG: glycosyltransferase, partial [Candidatus Bathyarchaeota archaeon]|nr:glycosyltransferase [Candidatus Bathyarchaeota archaeon]